MTKIPSDAQWSDLISKVKAKQALTAGTGIDATQFASGIVAIARDVIWPVGSYYETSDTSFDPNTAWGGTWVEDTAGRVLVAQDTGTFNSVGGTGGAETHTLSADEMPTHHHDFEEIFNSATRGRKARTITLRHNAGNPVDAGTSEITAAGSAYAGTAWMSWRELSVGGSQAHNNLQPYVVVKRWHRTA